MPSAINFVQSGKLRGLAVTTAQRSPATPDLPTIDETGVKGYDMGSWYGLAAPAGTPREVIARLNAEMLKVMKVPDVVKRLEPRASRSIYRHAGGVHDLRAQRSGEVGQDREGDQSQGRLT